MSKEAVFTVKLESDLRDRFMAEADAANRPASQIVREFMRDYIARQGEARAHDAWFRACVERGARDADNPSVRRIPHEEVADKWRRRRAELAARLGQDAQ